MISRVELNPHGYELTSDQKINFELLYVAMNALRLAYGRMMIITSGVRSKQDQERINPTQPNDAHTKAAACDVCDIKGTLWGWLMENLTLVQTLNLYLEDKSYTPTWVHFQVIAPKSGKRIFIP